MLKKYFYKLTPKLFLSLLFLAVWMFSAAPSPALMAFGIPLVIIGEFVRLWGAGHLEKNDKVVTSGPYAHVQNPLYVGTFLVICGFCIATASWIILALFVLIFSAYYVPYKKRKEAENLRKRFGKEFERYFDAVPAYFPSPKAYDRASDQKWAFWRVRQNEEHITGTSATAGAAFVLLKFYGVIHLPTLTEIYGRVFGA